MPELVAALRRLRRTERRYGWARLLRAAAATKICVDLRISAKVCVQPFPATASQGMAGVACQRPGEY